jgi:16S rRNA A1518/A1519 N6-dimethyltransferase RsmA/KsgA/DIM1 with predicted DNA glycosylase/AP lyase activity
MIGSKRQALGQHFLRDGGVARAIVDLVSTAA